MKRSLRRALLVLLVLALLGVLAFVAWGLTPLGPGEKAMAAMEPDGAVTVRSEGDRVLFAPAAGTPETGFVLYPGGHVDYRSYAPIARSIAERGFLVALVQMPLSLAVLGADRADGVMAAHPEIDRWAVGGHSLGGSMAASYAAGHADAVQGLVLWAAYPPSGTDLSGTGLAGLSAVGSNDGVIDRDALEATVPFLPPGTVVRVIQGGNHAQFGDYGPQPGDGTATISAEEQQAEAANLTVQLLQSIGPR